MPRKKQAKLDQNSSPHTPLGKRNGKKDEVDEGERIPAESERDHPNDRSSNKNRIQDINSPSKSNQPHNVGDDKEDADRSTPTKRTKNSKKQFQDRENTNGVAEVDHLANADLNSSYDLEMSSAGRQLISKVEKFNYKSKTHAIALRKKTFKGEDNLRGKEPHWEDYHPNIVHRKPHNWKTSLFDETTGELVCKILYHDRDNDAEAHQKLESFWDLSYKIQNLYRESKRGSATGKEMAPTYTFGYVKTRNGLVRLEDQKRSPHEYQRVVTEMSKDWNSKVEYVQEEIWQQIDGLADFVWEKFMKADSKIAKSMQDLDSTKHLQERKVVLGQTKETPFSGVTFNVGFEVNYHRDINDIKEGYSVTLVLWEENARPFPAGEVDEGMLVLPEYSIGFKIGHGDVYILKARDLYHGVTSAEHFRISIVFYQHHHI